MATTNRMLISARSARETRVALMHGEQLYDLDTENLCNLQRKANIYKGTVARIEPSLEAAFVDYGADRHGFLPLKEIARSCFKPGARVDSHNFSIKDVIREGQELLVQVEKEERGNKGAALTTFISLAGSYLVLMPNNPRVGGISRQIEGKERDELKECMKNLSIPDGMGAIIRTAGIGKSEEDLAWDLDILLKRWNAIDQAAQAGKAPLLIHREDDAVIRAIRDYLRYEVDEIIVDTESLYERAKRYIEVVRPDLLPKLRLYSESVSLFSHYRIERQIESVYQRVVKLPSGGSISIDPTEALISIDVNSARATGGSDIEETALNTNLEAADEIARQLRIRDIGGLVVIDFIDMSQLKNQRAVSQRLKEALSYDRARVKVGYITRFGLLEMSRQRIRNDLDSVSQCSCPRCEGRGSIRTIESLAASVVRVVEEVASTSNGNGGNNRSGGNGSGYGGNSDNGGGNAGYAREIEIQVIAPIDLASYLLNEYREILAEISHRLMTRVVVLPSRWMETPRYEIKRVNKRGEASYAMLAEAASDECRQQMADYEARGGLTATKQRVARVEQPVVSHELDDIELRKGYSASSGDSRSNNKEVNGGGFWYGAKQLLKNVIERLRGGSEESERQVATAGAGERARGGAGRRGCCANANSVDGNGKNGGGNSRHANRKQRAKMNQTNVGNNGGNNSVDNASNNSVNDHGYGVSGNGGNGSRMLTSGAEEMGARKSGRGAGGNRRRGAAGEAPSGEREAHAGVAINVDAATSLQATADLNEVEQTGKAGRPVEDDAGASIGVANGGRQTRSRRNRGGASGAPGAMSAAASSDSVGVTGAANTINTAETGVAKRLTIRRYEPKRAVANQVSEREAENAKVANDKRQPNGEVTAAVAEVRASAENGAQKSQTLQVPQASSQTSQASPAATTLSALSAAKIGPVEGQAVSKTAGAADAAIDGKKTPSAAVAPAARRVPDTAYSRMALFRSGLLGPVASRVEVPFTVSQTSAARKAAPAPAKKKPLIGPVSLDSVIKKEGVTSERASVAVQNTASTDAQGAAAQQDKSDGAN